MIKIFRKRLEVIPATEPIVNFNSYRLKRGHIYLVKEPKSENSSDIFTSMIKGTCAECRHPNTFSCESIGCEECTLSCPCKHCVQDREQGLCLTIDSPVETRERYLLQTTPIFWISKYGTESINPANLEQMMDIIKEFLRKSKNPIVLLIGLEYLIITNGFIPVLKFIYEIREWIILHQAIFILPVNPAIFNEKELALIERNTEQPIY